MGRKTKSHVGKSAQNVESATGVQYHLKVKKGDLSNLVLMPGDPQRVKNIAKDWDFSKKIAEYRQFVSYTGEFKGTKISAVSSGIGPPACEIAVAELKNVGVDTILRVGSCGVLKKEIDIGDLVISEAAVRLEDTSGHYIMPEYPAVASRKITNALIRACEENNLPYHVGITASTSSFYAGQGREYQNYLPSHRTNLIKDLTKANVVNVEMEASLLFVLGSIFNIEMGAICAVYANRVNDEMGVKGEKLAIIAANEAIKIIDDYNKDDKKYWY